MISSVSNEKIKYLKRLKDSKYMNEERFVKGNNIVRR